MWVLILLQCYGCSWPGCCCTKFDGSMPQSSSRPGTAHRYASILFSAWVFAFVFGPCVVYSHATDHLIIQSDSSVIVNAINTMLQIPDYGNQRLMLQSPVYKSSEDWSIKKIACYTKIGPTIKYAISIIYHAILYTDLFSEIILNML